MAGAIDENIQSCMRLSRAGANHGLVVLPLAVKPFKFSVADLMPSFVGDGSADGPRAIAAHIGGEAVFGATFHADAAEAGVVKAIARFVHANAEVMRIVGVQRILGS